MIAVRHHSLAPEASTTHHVMDVADQPLLPSTLGSMADEAREVIKVA
jgi:hypothetical protein